MADIRYGFVDMGDQILNYPQNNGSNSSDFTEVNSKLNEITKDAPKELDTFKEVAEKIDSITEQIKGIESGNCGDCSCEIDYKELYEHLGCKYVTKEESTMFATDAELAAAVTKISEDFTSIPTNKIEELFND